MTNSMVIRCALGGLICLAVGVGFSAETEASIERVVEPGGPGGNRLEVDVALLAEAEDDFRDLRLVSAGKKSRTCSSIRHGRNGGGRRV